MRTTYRIDYDGKNFTISRTVASCPSMPILTGVKTNETARAIVSCLRDAEERGYVAGYRDGYVNGRVDGLSRLTAPTEDQLAILHSEIHALGLTVRTYNCLRRENIDTVADLISKTRDDVLDIRNLGEKSFTEITEKLADLGFSLRRPLEIAVY